MPVLHTDDDDGSVYLLCAHINKAYRSPGMQTHARPDASVLQVLDEMRHENVAWQILKKERHELEKDW